MYIYLCVRVHLFIYVFYFIWVHGHHVLPLYCHMGALNRLKLCLKPLLINVSILG